MRPRIKILFSVLFLVLSLVAAAAAQDRAILKRNGANLSVEVHLATAVDPARNVVAGVYETAGGKKKQLQKFEQKVTSSAGGTLFTIPLTATPTDEDKLSVSIFEFPTADGIFSHQFTVGKEMTPELGALIEQCRDSFQLKLRSVDYSEADWDDIYKWAEAGNNDLNAFAKVNVKVGSELSKQVSLESVRVITLPKAAERVGAMTICIKTEADFPTETFDATLTFAKAPKVDLQKEISGEDLTGASIPDTPKSGDDNGLPGERGLERNLDVGVSFTSSVGEQTAEDGSTFIDRTNRGTFDIRIAPLLNWGPGKPKSGQKLYRYFTPFYLDAAVSTGKIDKDTLSMNRVIMGSEFEWRYYGLNDDKKSNKYINIHRFILSGEHASDRDFKQKEFLASFEYEPRFGLLNRPIHKRWKDVEGEIVPAKIGWQIIPRVGFTLGRTYSRRNPAAVIEASPNVRRLHFGLDVTLGLTRYVQLNLTDTFYVRGEAPGDRGHNYFKGSVEMPFGRPFARSVNSMFFSFERGGQPPFASRDVNVFKIGYRIRSQGWFGQSR